MYSETELKPIIWQFDYSVTIKLRLYVYKVMGGRFDMPTNKLVESYNATIMLEQRLCPFDIKGSIAHATMLGLQGIITQDEANAIIGGLTQVNKEIESRSIHFRYCR